MEIANPPLISVITAVYNGEKYFEQTIQSVLQQTYQHIEYLVIDGQSTDNTVNIIRKYEKKLAYWISEKDNGVYNAWNKGIAKAKGDWVIFLGADDFLWDKEVIEKSIIDINKAISENIRYAYGKVNLLSRSGEKIISVWGQPWREAKKNIFRYMTVTHCGAFHHKSLFEDYGKFDETFRITGDYEFILRELSKQKEAFFINNVITGMRVGGLSADLLLKLTVAQENRKALEANNLPVSFHHKLQVYKAHFSNLLIKIIGLGKVKKIADIYRRLRGKDRRWSEID